MRHSVCGLGLDMQYAPAGDGYEWGVSSSCVGDGRTLFVTMSISSIIVSIN